jgi:hypothetical protein
MLGYLLLTIPAEARATRERRFEATSAAYWFCRSSGQQGARDSRELQQFAASMVVWQTAAAAGAVRPAEHAAWQLHSS